VLLVVILCLHHCYHYSHRAAVTIATMIAEPHRVLENRLFKLFKGYTWSERIRNTNSWIWTEGYNIQHKGAQPWVCKTCIRMHRPIAAHFNSGGFQNAKNHLRTSHQIGAPNGEKKNKAQRRNKGIPNQPSIATLFNLNVSHQRDQQLANSLIRSFDRHHLYRLLVEFIISNNLPFSLVDNKVFRNMLKYLNPSVRIRQTVPSSHTIRRIIYQKYKKHHHTIINFLAANPGKIYISFNG
jgi:hypothetical protein